VKSVRLDPAREARLKQAAAAAGVTESEFIRVGELGEQVAHRTSETFLEMLVEQEKRDRR
jgi:hypothetical protein